MDMNIPEKSKVFPIPTEIISDGKVLTKNLEKLNLDINWITQQLKQKNIHSVSDVFFAQIQTDGTISIYKKENGLKA